MIVASHLVDRICRGIELVMPDLRFLEDEVDNIVGMVLTHAHEDHYGGVMDLWPQLECDVYASPFAAAMLKAKGRSNNFGYEVPVKIVQQGATFELGPFKIEMINVAHSIPESSALYIETPAGRVLHTGDWKLDPSPVGNAKTDEKRLREIGAMGAPLALVSDSTNAVRDGESQVRAMWRKALRN